MSRVLSAPVPDDVHNTRAWGQLMYTRYIYLFQSAGVILLFGDGGCDCFDVACAGGVFAVRWYPSNLCARGLRVLRLEKSRAVVGYEVMVEIGITHYLTVEL